MKILGKDIMKNKDVESRKEIEKYREKIFRAKEESRRAFAAEPFEKKLKIAFQLYEMAKYLKKFRQNEQNG